MSKSFIYKQVPSASMIKLPDHFPANDLVWASIPRLLKDSFLDATLVAWTGNDEGHPKGFCRTWRWNTLPKKAQFLAEKNSVQDDGCDCHELTGKIGEFSYMYPEPKCKYLFVDMLEPGTFPWIPIQAWLGASIIANVCTPNLCGKGGG